MRLRTEEKKSLVARYRAGESVAENMRQCWNRKKHFLYLDQTLHGNQDRFRLCGQSAGIYQDEATDSKIGAESGNSAKSRLYCILTTSRKVTGTYETVWPVQCACTLRGPLCFPWYLL